MNLRKLTAKARDTIEARGGSERAKQDAKRLRDIATSKRTTKEKATAAMDALRAQRT